MAKAPRRTVSKPAEGGALPCAEAHTTQRRPQPRNERGVFITFAEAEALGIAAAAPQPDIAEPVDPPRKPKSSPRTRRASPPERLVARVLRAIDGELCQIEAIMNDPGSSPAKRSAAEKHARTMASLTRTLAEMMRLRDNAKEERADDDDGPLDLDAFRRFLERRMAQLVDPPARAIDRGDELEANGCDQHELGPVRA